MRRILIGGIALLLCGAIAARILPAPASRPDALTFVFLRVDRSQDVSILRPMIGADMRVQLHTGPREMKRGTVLHCTTFTREQSAIVEGQTATIGELWLDCGDHKFVVKGLDFTQRAK